MRPSDLVGCAGFPCAGVDHAAFRVPAIELDAGRVRIVMVSEGAAPAACDDYYAPGRPLFAETTVQAFRDAGAAVETLADVLALGVYATTAVKCAKTASGIATPTVLACSVLLERELALFPSATVYLLMGDVAIRAVNAIARRAGEPRPVPPGATYRIRGGTYTFRGRRVLPSYLQAGPAYFIEAAKRRMIAQDIRTALDLAAPQAATD